MSKELSDSEGLSAFRLGLWTRFADATRISPDSDDFVAEAEMYERFVAGLSDDEAGELEVYVRWRREMGQILQSRHSDHVNRVLAAGEQVLSFRDYLWSCGVDLSADNDLESVRYGALDMLTDPATIIDACERVTWDTYCRNSVDHGERGASFEEWRERFYRS